MPSSKRPHNDAYKDKRDALRRIGRRDELPCWICRMPIDYDLPWKHPQSYTYDHDQAIASGGSMRGQGRPAHRACNARRGAGREVKLVEATNVSGGWLAGPRLGSI